MYENAQIKGFVGIKKDVWEFPWVMTDCTRASTPVNTQPASVEMPRLLVSQWTWHFNIILHNSLTWGHNEPELSLGALINISQAHSALKRLWRRQASHCLKPWIWKQTASTILGEEKWISLFSLLLILTFPWASLSDKYYSTLLIYSAVF